MKGVAGNARGKPCNGKAPVEQAEASRAEHATRLAAGSGRLGPPPPPRWTSPRRDGRGRVEEKEASPHVADGGVSTKF